MKKFVSALVAVMLLILAVVPMTCAGAEGTQMYVSSANGKGVNLRAAATKNSSVICKLGEGKPVDRLQKVNTEWSYISVKVNGNTLYGYAMNQFLSAKDPTQAAQTFHRVNAYKVVVTPSRGSAGFVNLRAKANTSSTCIARLYQGELLTVTAESSAFLKVTDSQGHTGYVVKAFVKAC